MEKIREIDEISSHLHQLKSSAANLYHLMEKLKELYFNSMEDRALKQIFYDFQKVGFFFIQYIDVKITHSMEELQITERDQTLKIITKKLINEAEIECGVEELQDLCLLDSYFNSHKYLFCQKCRNTDLLDKTTTDMLHSCVASMVCTMGAIGEMEKYLNII